MQIFNCEQGTSEWLASRAGVITASNFHLLRGRIKTGPNKGDFTATARKYARRLALERLSGTNIDDSFTTPHTLRGSALEGEARAEYELQTLNNVDEVGFYRTESFGYSPDGVVGEDGLIEIKCFTDADKIVEIITENNIGIVQDQVQGGMWVTGRQWCDFVLYIPSLRSVNRDLIVTRIERDNDYIAELEKDLREFNGMVKQIKTELEEKLKLNQEIVL